MSYIALARKWRPRTFSQLVGQDHINKALINSLNQQRLHHAYLFTGTRGVGKTSVARLMAKALNCEKGISSEPCLECNACVAIEQGRFIDLVEIDGASRTRVEDTREILENVQYAPTSGRFKIYLIDEVHMLSQHSFNALLKTLEEPPAHVKFILATTDPQKLPVTVLSRCLQFNLKHLQPAVISWYLQHILDEEKFKYDIQAVDLLATAARGSMRDALSLLDQAIASCEQHLQIQDVKDCLGYTQLDYALQLLSALAELDTKKLLTLCKKIAEEGSHFRYVLDEILGYLHQISVWQCIKGNSDLISLAPGLAELGMHFSPEDIQLFYQIALKGSQDILLAPSMAIGFEMTILRMYTFKPASRTPMPPLACKTIQKPETIDPGTNTIRDAEPSDCAHTRLSSDDTLSPISPEPEIVAQTHQETLDEPPPPLFEDEKAESELVEQKEPVIARPEVTTTSPATIPWAEMLAQLNLHGLALTAAEHTEFVSKATGQVVLRVEKGHQSVFTNSVISRIEQELSGYYNEKISLTLTSDQHVSASPLQQKQVTLKKQQADAETALQNDPFFQQIQHEFSAELVKNSIVLLKDEL